eukprot:3565716-Prymnesium_polylepis.1
MASRYIKGPPRKGGKPTPKTAPMSPSRALAMTPLCRQWTASETKRKTTRSTISSGEMALESLSALYLVMIALASACTGRVAFLS